MTIEQKFLSNVDLLTQDNKGSSYLVAVSGGQDSMVLLDLARKQNLPIQVVHVNYQLRGKDSDADEELVKEYCAKHAIPFHSRRVNTKEEKPNQLSLQMYCREVRYDFFNQILAENAIDYLLTAHHLRDDIETMFMKFLRSSGIKGLKGIPSKNGNYLRPLLNISKKEMEAYAKENKLAWREDKSNASTDYLRNRIRHNIIPEIEDLEENFESKIGKSLSILKEIDAYLDTENQKLFKTLLRESDNGVFEAEISAIQGLPNFQKIALFQGFGMDNLDEIEKLLQAHTGSQFEWKKYTLHIDRSTIYFVPNTKQSIVECKIENLPFERISPSYLRLEISNNADQNAHFVWDADKVKTPLFIRARQDGDVFFPEGMMGSKKISKYLKDEKIPNFQKNKIELLTDAENTILAILPLRKDRRKNVDEKSRKFLNIYL